MSDLNIKNSPDEEALDNAIYKLKIYMDRTKQTLHGLANTMGFAYQPFYRLMTKKHIPTISSFGLIASHLNCTISELTNDTFFLDINYYQTLVADFTEESTKKCRVYIPHEKYKEFIHEHFFALSTKVFKDNAMNYWQDNLFYLFFITKDIKIDGLFLVEYKNEVTIINVTSVSSKFIVIESDGVEQKVELKDIKPKARLFNYLEITNDNHTKIFGIS
jgi:hypothetical protein